MATLTKGQTFGATETVTNTKLHNLVDNATISGIVDADISAGAQIQFSKIAQGDIDGSLLINLDNISSGSGKVPFANLNVPFGSTYVSLVSIPNASLQPLTLASWVDGAAMRNIQSIPTLAGQVSWYNIVSSIASGSFAKYAGGNTFVGAIVSSPIVKSIQFWNASVAGSSTRYSSFGIPFTDDNDNASFGITPIAFTIKNLSVGVNDGFTNTIVATMRKNRADTSLVATVLANATTAIDSTNTVSYVAGDLVSFKIVNNRWGQQIAISAEVDI